MLSVILLFSCENNENCIDANDYGDVEKEIINVPASLSNECFNVIKPTSNSERYEDITNGILRECLTKTDLNTDNNYDIKSIIKGMLKDGGTKNDYPNPGTGCKEITIYENKKACEQICEKICSDLSTNNNPEQPINWKPNTPKGKDSTGIDITHGSNIFVSAEGEIALNTTIANTASRRIQEISEFRGNDVVKLEFDASYDGFSTQQFHVTPSPSIENIGKMQELARRSMFFYIPDSEKNEPIKLEKKIDIDEPTLPLSVNGIITYNSSNDRLINFKKVRTANCQDAKINVSIKKNGTDITYYELTNLELSEIYTSKNIPTYTNSTIEIKINNLTDPSKPDDCLIKMQNKSYVDTLISYSGIAQFKTSADSCKLYGRIINPGADKMIYKDPANPPSDKIAIKDDADLDKVYIVSNSNFTNPGGNYKVKNVYIGLNAYADKGHKNIAESSCQRQQNFPSCKIESDSCSINSNEYREAALLPLACTDGSGLEGSIEFGKAGNGGGGGGNTGGDEGKYTEPYKAGGGGKGGKSYVNPEFQLDKPVADFPNLEKGKGAPNNDNSFRNGYVDIWWKGSNPNEPTSITFNNQVQSKIFTIPQNNKILYYKIYGGGGGAGGNCVDKSGGKGGDGDSFSGTLDFTNFSSGSNITLKIKVGSGGNSGKDCDSNTPQNASKNPDIAETNKKLKGGDGGIMINNAVSNEASGGAGGSASYISLVRSDESNDPLREDFLVIAGGGGGGGGAKEINGVDANRAESYTNELKSTANGLRLAVFLESIPVMNPDFSSDFYEYDDFFTKIVSNSNDPLRSIDISSNFGDGFFVRKGQILRILPKSVDASGCNNEIFMKTTRRPAVLCLSGIKESIKNPLCIPKIVINQDKATYQGCSASSSCITCDNIDPENPCPVNIQDTGSYCRNLEMCAKINCSIPGTDIAPNAGCSIAPIPSECLASCSGCASKRKEEMERVPTIEINSHICYNFEGKDDISINNFLSEYNSIPSSNQDALKNLVSRKNIQKIENFNPSNKFGNFNDNMKAPNNGFFETKDTISFGSTGKLDKLIIKNNDFKTVDNIASKTPDGNYKIYNEEPQRKLNVRVVFTNIFQKGRSLDVALCENSEDKPCYSFDPKILAYFVNNSKTDAENPYKFNSYGILEKTAKPLNAEPGINNTISDCQGLSSGDNFICFQSSETDKQKHKNYRLIFKVNDKEDNRYSNNSGEYNVKVEKRIDSKNRSEGIINGILEPIITNLDGKKDDPKTPTTKEEKPGMVRNFYITLINNPLYKVVLTLTIVLALSFYGMGYLMGVNELKHSEVVKILLKIGFIYLFTSTTIGWSWFNKFFVGFFKNATDYIAFSVAETFDYENSKILKQKISDSDYYDRGVLFKSVDSVIGLILAGAVQKKIMALLFSSVFGWLYFLILYYSLFTYVYAVANSMLLYITCQIIISILFVLGPIFFIFLMFKITKDMFDNWLKALIGFSLQQIFLVMTLALFNSFVIGFLKLALGYRVCWTDILSLNLYVSKITLLNFWTVAGTNSPNLVNEDSVDESFGIDENMPSIYLFLYLMLIVSLMKKFIELFTDLAVTIAGGLKASSIASDSATIGKTIFKAASAAANKLYKNTAGRVVSKIDDTLFDSGSIASERRKAERQQFTNDMKTRVELNKAGNEAVSEHKKNNALHLASMSVDKQKETLRGVREKAIEDYATNNGISTKELNRITNDWGLKNSGSNLFGMAIQAGRQSVFSGGSLFNSMNDKNIKIDNSFSKSEANSALKRMKSDNVAQSDGEKKKSADEKRKDFIQAVQDGHIHVNKGKLENARKSAIGLVKAPVNAILSPKTTLKAVGGKTISTLASAPMAVAKRLPLIGNKTKFKNEVIKNLQNAGKITRQSNWLARTTEENNIIEKAVREKYMQEKISLPKVTSNSVIKDLEATKNYIKEVEKNNGALKYNENDSSFRASVNRAGERANNFFSSGDDNKANRAMQMHDENLKKLKKERSDKENDPDNKGSIENLNKLLRDKLEDDKKLQHKIGLNIDDFKRSKSYNFYNFRKMHPRADDGTRYGGFDIKGFREKITSDNLEKVKEIRENRYNINEITSNIKDAEEKNNKIEEYEKNLGTAKKIVENANKRMEEYDKKPRINQAGNFILSKLSSITLVRPIVRGINYFGSNKVKYPSILKDRERYKKDMKIVKEFNKIKDPEKLKDFVKNHEKKANLTSNSAISTPPLSSQTTLTIPPAGGGVSPTPTPPPSSTPTPTATP